jgi:hypothetical protein
MFIGALVGVMLGGNLGILVGHPVLLGILAGVGGMLAPAWHGMESSGHRLL